mmetsp:Transcript_25466/g.40187  ORF Transcript_25466/g.40187 Transcript_25466/m.40187 type:complete len:85 (+) Transcript_25466:662-916(+)
MCYTWHLGHYEALEEDQRAGELQLTQDGIGRNPKSYPAWHQRQWLIIHLDSPDLSQVKSYYPKLPWSFLASSSLAEEECLMDVL